MKQYIIGIAGHIDHGKTELTKALTGVDTDRLKEEKDRRISIELGYAPLYEDNTMSLSIIDVPGHERFIRQMIAGVSGVDMTLIVVAADDGVMPQTIEHIEILNDLQINNALIVITKVDFVDQEWLQLVQDELMQYIKGTGFEQAPFYLVDSLSGGGIDDLYQDLIRSLEVLPYREPFGHFRMPIDQAFQIHGIGTVVRGTVLDGRVHVNDQLKLQPGDQSISIKNIEQFGKSVHSSSRGSRTALAIKGIETKDIKRGDVLTKHPDQSESYRIDVEFRSSRYLVRSIKQRSPIKLHIGTSEVFGRIILFDRNEINESGITVYAQIELQEPIYTFRHDMFVLRRATPQETIGGGKVIQASAQKHRFGQKTADTIQRAAIQSSSEQLLDYLHNEEPLLSEATIADILNLQKTDVHDLIEDLMNKQLIREIDQSIASTRWLEQQFNDVIMQLQTFHYNNPMAFGLDKSIVIQTIKAPSNKARKKVLDDWIENDYVVQDHHLIKLPEFEPYIPNQIKDYVNDGLDHLRRDGLTVKEWNEYFPELAEQTLESLKSYCLSKEIVIQLTAGLIVRYDVFYASIQTLYQACPNYFSLGDAKEALQVSRKYLIPFLETCDQLGETIREEQQRYWT